MNNDSHKNSIETVLSGVFALIRFTLGLVIVLYALGFGTYGWLLLLRGGKKGKEELTAVIEMPIAGLYTLCLVFCASVIAAMVDLHNPSFPTLRFMADNCLTWFVVYSIVPWTLLLFLFAAVAMKSTKLPTPPKDPRDRPLFKNNPFVIQSRRPVLYTVFYLVMVPMMVLTALVDAPEEYVWILRALSAVTAFLVLRFMLLPLLMRHSSAGVLTHAAWVLALVLWPVYSTAVAKLGIPKGIYQAIQSTLCS